MSGRFLLVFLAILPVILILLFVYNKDKDKEPVKLLMQFFILGIISCFLVVIISSVLALLIPLMSIDTNSASLIEVLLYSFLSVALVEEFCKWIMVYKKGYNHQEFDEVYDIIVYSVFVSLGFAFFENMVYVLGNQNISVAIMRAISAVPGHACDAIFMGYYLSMAKKHQNRKEFSQERQNIYLSIFIPTILHGIYDFCLMSNLTILVIMFVVFIIYLYIISIKKIKALSQDNKSLQKKYKYCVNCGAIVNGNFCGNCGTRQD